MSEIDAIIELIRDELAATVLPLERRVIANKVRRLVDEYDLPSRAVQGVKLGVEDLDPMGLIESITYGQERMGFGRFAGLSRDETPLEYLAWLADEKRAEWRNLLRYVKARRNTDPETTDER